MPDKIRTFTDLIAWKEAHKLAIVIYKSTDDFPINEKYSLIDQMRRAAVSISSNIAEGFSRQTNKEKIQFYYIAKGSLTELQNQLLLSRDVNYIDKSLFTEIAEQTILADKLLMGLIKSLKNKS